MFVQRIQEQSVSYIESQLWVSRHGIKYLNNFHVILLVFWESSFMLDSLWERELIEWTFLVNEWTRTTEVLFL
jgi:hypothetical protein